MPRVPLKALKAARVYLEMRGYALQEQRWSQGKNSIDLIALKDQQIFFVSVRYSDTPAVMSRSESQKLLSAVSAWADTNKSTAPLNHLDLALDPGSLAVLSLNESKLI
jgi:Holliday junction resolvase-like predicted endonuclease